MLEIRSKLKIPRAAYNLEVQGRLHVHAHGDHFHAVLESGEEVALKFATAEVLKNGDLVTASDGRVLEVVAAEPVQVQAGEHHHHHDHDH
ncbi:MAG TPA: hypothetical protein VD965_10035 [Burkholderiales bacterium]|nr:hypothetical protein [Burkholderiales bacterium]